MGANEEYLNKVVEELARKEAEKQALIEEFTKSIPLEWTPEDLKEKFRTLLASAYARIAQTIKDDEHPKSFEAAKYAMSIGMGQIQIKDDNDPNKEFTELLKSMKPLTPEEKVQAENKGVLAKLINDERTKNSASDAKGKSNTADSE